MTQKSWALVVFCCRLSVQLWVRLQCLIYKMRVLDWSFQESPTVSNTVRYLKVDWANPVISPRPSFAILYSVLSERGRQQGKPGWAQDLDLEGKTKQNKNNTLMSRGFREAGQLNRQSTGSKVYGLGEQVAI